MFTEFADINLALDVLSLVIMFIVIVGRKRYHTETPEGRLFYFLVWITLGVVLIDTAFRVLDGSALFANILVALKTIYLILNTLLLFSWVIYVDYRIFGNADALKKRITFYLIPSSINFVLLIINIFTPAVFSLANNNTIVFETWGISLYTALNYVYVIYYLVLTVACKKQIRKVDYLPLLLFCAPALICSVLQIVFQGISLVCGYAVSTLIVYTHLQQTLSYTDGLTGLINRRSLTDYLLRVFRSDNGSYYLSGIMLDVDSLKRRNDTFGHGAGDDTLISIAKILSKSVEKDYPAARYAGDEFMVICRSKDPTAANRILEKIQQNKAQFNSTTQKPYKIEFSVGIYTCTTDECTSMDEFLQRTDEAMYLVKNEKKTDTLNN